MRPAPFMGAGRIAMLRISVIRTRIQFLLFARFLVEMVLSDHPDRRKREDVLEHHPHKHSPKEIWIHNFDSFLGVPVQHDCSNMLLSIKSPMAITVFFSIWRPAAGANMSVNPAVTMASSARLPKSDVILCIGASAGHLDEQFRQARRIAERTALLHRARRYRPERELGCEVADVGEKERLRTVDELARAPLIRAQQRQDHLECKSADDEDVRPETGLSGELGLIEIDLRGLARIAQRELLALAPESGIAFKAGRLAGNDVENLAHGGFAPAADVYGGRVGV